MNNIKKFFRIALATVFCACLCSCYDASEVEETAYVIALGIDRGDKENNLYTFQIAAPLGSSPAEENGAFLSGGGEDGEESSEEKASEEIIVSNNKSVKNIVVAGDDFYTAKSLLANFMSKKISFSHLKMIVFSHKAADEVIMQHIEIFSKERQIRPKTFIAVAKDGAERYLKLVNPELEASTARYYELSNSKEKLFYAPAKTLGEFMKETENSQKSSVLPLAVIKKANTSKELEAEVSSAESVLSSSKAEMLGMVVFKDEKIVAEADGGEALCYNILSGQTKTLVYPFDSDGKTNFLKVSFVKKPRFKIKSLNGVYNAEVTLYLKLKYMGEDDESGKKTSLGAKMLKNELEDFLNRTAKEYNADIFGLANIEKKRYKNISKAEASPFEREYKNCTFSVNQIVYGK